VYKQYHDDPIIRGESFLIEMALGNMLAVLRLPDGK
jgi:hypothetical protein